MFYYISGKLVLTEANAAVIDNQGIAYRLTISGSTHAKLSSKIGGDAKLFTYLNVREDGLDLFGFYTQEELNAFRLLISVSGVGPKAAMSVLSQMSPEKFAVAVGMGDTKAISRAPGVGAKTAARIILELKDKIAKQLSQEEAAQGFSGDDFLPAKSNVEEAVNALLVLGYTRGEAASVLKGMDPAMPLEEMITAALKKLVK
ncbi:MAG: Holliday junction branch migration protein RuvA [Clostridia bacterium]|nr:Holliday junction branch migration protein RuvA [Clostridia bacterium]